MNTEESGAPAAPDGAVHDFSTDKALTLEQIEEYHAKSPNKKQIICYLMRLWPEIDMRRVTGPKGTINIDKAELLTRDYILSKHGSGDYQISFHDMSRPRALRRVGTCIAEIHEPGRDPLVDLATVVWESPKNRSFVAMLAQQGRLPAGVAVGGLTGVPAAPVVPPAANGGSSRSLMAEVQESLQVASLFKGGAAAGGDGVKDSLIIPLLTHMANTNIQLMERLAASTAAPPAARGGLGDLKETISLLQTLGWSAPGAGGGGAVAAAAPAVSEESMLSMLAPAASIVRDIKDVILAFARPAAMPAAGQVIDTTAAGVPADDTGGEEPEPAGSLETAATAATNHQNGESAMLLTTIGQFAQPAYEAFKAGRPAAEYAAVVYASKGGPAMLADLVKAGTKKLESYLNLAPGLEEMLERDGLARKDLDIWVRAFLRGADQALKSGGA